MGRASRRLLARPPKIFDRLGEVIAASVMMRQIAQMVVQLLGEHRLQRLTGALVQELAPLDQQRVVGDLLRQRMLKRVLNPGLQRAVRRGTRPLASPTASVPVARPPWR